jgi:hypothetical protein
MVRLFEAAAIPADAGAPAGAKSKMQRAYASAIESLAKYPLEITSAVEAEQLHGSQSNMRR